MEDSWIQDTLLGVVIPEASNTTIADALAKETDLVDSESDSLLPSIKQRSLLFFDERITAYIVFQFPVGLHEALKDILPRLDLRLDAHAINGQPNENDARRSHDQPGSGRDVIFSQRLEKTGDPFIAINEEETEGDSKALAIWEVEVVLNRPRIRLPTPAIIFSTIGSIRPVNGPAADPDEEDLPPYRPLPVNVLDAFKTDLSMKDALPYLSSATLSRISPSSAARPSLISVPSQASTSIRIIPAVSARIRYSRMNNFSQRPRTVASLDFEVTPYIRCDVVLDAVDVSISDEGTIEPITQTELPISCRPRDDLTFLYTLIPSDQSHAPGSSTSLIATLEIHLSTQLQVSSICTPRITMRWRTSVDFTIPLNPSYGAASQILQRNNRPTHLSTLPTNSSFGIPTNLTDFSTNSAGAPPTLTTTSPDTSLTITFTAPPHPVKLGTIFSWTILLVNHSPRSRKFALVAITSRTAPRRPQSSITSALPSSTQQHHQSSTKPPTAPTAPEVAPAYVDSSHLHAMQHTTLTTTSHNSSPLICMSPDVRIGPLGAGAAHECEMKLLALRKGWLRVEGIRVIDVGASERLSTGSSIVGGGPGPDGGGPGAGPVEWFVRDLPDIWVVGSGSGGEGGDRMND